MTVPRVAVLTVSDRAVRGERPDVSGETIARWVEARGWILSCRATVADETQDITRVLTEWADTKAADVILTTGGTGLAPRDVTPEATAACVERHAPGIAERLRAAGMASTPYSALGRGVAGTRGGTLIVNLPGSPRAVSEGLEILGGILPHAIALLRGEATEH